MAKAYSKYGAAIPDDLLSYIEQLLEELGLLDQPGAGNDTTASPQGEMVLLGTLKGYDIDLLVS